MMLYANLQFIRLTIERFLEWLGFFATFSLKIPFDWMPRWRVSFDKASGGERPLLCPKTEGKAQGSILRPPAPDPKPVICDYF